MVGSLRKGGSELKKAPVLLKDPKKRWWVIAPIIGVLALIGGLIFYEAYYLPSQQSQQATLQTTVARRGDIVISASGTGTLQAANQADLAFKTSGKLSQLNVKVGDQVKKGQLMAQLDNAAQELQYEKAQETLAGFTSVSAIGSAQQAMAKGTQNVNSAELQLEYLLSPDVYYWENEITKDEQAVKGVQAAFEGAPSDATLNAKLTRAKAVLDFARDKLKDAQGSYKDYVLDTFTVQQFNPATKTIETTVQWPTAADITKARQDLTIAQGALTDAQNLYAALTGGDIPADASGSSLIALEQAKLDLRTAQDNLQATQLFAPFSGTVVSVSAQPGDSIGTTAIMTVADLSKLYVQTYVDESDYSMFKVGNQASVVFDALPDQTFTGKVVQVSPALDTSSGSSVVSGLVQLDPTSAELLIGMGASVNVIAGQAQNAVLVPIAALHEYSTGKYAVFVMRNGKLGVNFVQVGLKDLVNAEIKSGLQPGDIVSTGLLGTKQQ